MALDPLMYIQLPPPVLMVENRDDFATNLVDWCDLGTAAAPVYLKTLGLRYRFVEPDRLVDRCEIHKSSKKVDMDSDFSFPTLDMLRVLCAQFKVGCAEVATLVASLP